MQYNYNYPKTGGSDTWWKNDCHWGNVHLLNVEAGDTEVQLFGGGLTNGANPDAVDLALLFDASGMMYDSPNVPPAWRIAKHMPQVVYLPISDYAAPPWPAEFWLDLVSDIVTQGQRSKKPEYKVLLACQGGHGRTGTALAALISKLEFKVPDGLDLLTWLRSRYCTNIIESASQLQYLKEEMGIHVPGTIRPTPITKKAGVWVPSKSGSTGSSVTSNKSDEDSPTRSTWVQGPLPKEWE